MKVVLIHWVDATSFDSWESVADALKSKLNVVKTIGFLVKETDDTLQLALNWDEQGDQVSQYILIPKAWVRSRRDVRINLKETKRAEAKQAPSPDGGDPSRS